MEGKTLSTFSVVILFAVHFPHSCDDLFLEQCAAVESVLSYPRGKSALGAVESLHPGAGVPGMITSGVALQSDASMSFRLINRSCFICSLILLYLGHMNTADFTFPTHCKD